MNIEEIKRIYNEKNKVSFKIFGLDYTIEKINSSVIIYANMYEKKYKIYPNIDDLLNYYFIYGEELITYNNKIQNIH